MQGKINMQKSFRELKNLKVKLEEEINTFNGEKAKLNKLKDKLKNVNKQLEELKDEQLLA
jgi:prefoldin subunit 5